MESSKNSYIASVILLWNQLQVIESSANLAFHKHTSQSSDYDTRLLSSYAVDGKHKECATVGFAHTRDGDYEWWQVDLGDICEIKKIQIYYRPNYLNRLDGYAINITKSLNPLETWQCYKDTENGLPTTLTPSHICRRLGRYVKISRERTSPDSSGDKAMINLCEVEVYGCPEGNYGNGNCNSSCSAGCVNSRCDPDNGQCNCRIGWTGDKCEQCVDGYYGDKCTNCSEGCLDRKCDQINGHCTCKESFYGNTCRESCPSNCKNNRCNQSTGACVGGCKTSSFKGKKCDECVNGTYGKNCDEECPSNCYLSKCYRMDGSCSDGCKYKNLIGSRCEVCVVGLYGKNCDIACPVNCKHRICDGTDGTCMFGCKHANMTGNQCDSIRTTMEGQAFQIKSYIASIISGVVSLINIVFIAVILVLYCKRRRSKETVYENQKSLDSTQEGRNQQDNYNMEQHQTVHYETLGLDDRGSVNTNSAEAYTGLNVNTEDRY